MADRRLACHVCSTVAVFDGPVGRGACCQRCGADLRCCYNCRFYDASAYNECAEPAAERVVDKERANFCDYFAPSPGSGDAAGEPASGNGALGSLEDLFRKH